MDNLGELERKIQEQIETYLPGFQLNEVTVSKKGESELAINIRIRNTVFSLVTTEDDDLKLADL